MEEQFNPFDLAQTQTKTYTKKEAIELIQDAIKINFSDEQRKIAENDFSKPLLVNACAGSGKTTLFILTVLVAILTKQARPDQILGITFSKMAQEDMVKRYEEYANKLTENDISLPVGTPKFSTFHAFFLSLLKTNPKYQNVHILNGWQSHFTELNKAIKVPSKFLSEYDQLEQIFEHYDNTINSQITTDGLTLTNPDKYSNVFEAGVKENMNVPNLNLIDNYIPVVTKYNQIKKRLNAIDFNDMKLLLLESMDDPTAVKRYNSISHRYEIAYLDEFQDIDPIQWQLCKKLLKKSTYDSMIAVGDDDQAIYRFRGSDPKYILNYQDWQPNEVTLNLSTNYRTAKNILNTAKPVITQNPTRLDKKLNAFNDGGEITYTKSYNGYFNADDKILSMLKERITKYPDHKIAVLVRHNTDRMFISDWLANQNILTNVYSSSKILQNNKIYRVYMGLMKAIYYNDAGLFIEHCKNIGFTKLQNQLKSYGKAEVQVNPFDTSAPTKTTAKTTLDDLLDVYLKFINRRDWHNEKNIQNIETVVRMRNGIKRNHTKISTLFSAVLTITTNYYNYMVKNHFVDENALQTVRQYLTSVISQLNTLDPSEVFEQFFKWEEVKAKQLIDIADGKKTTSHKNVSIITMHQSKGLEFDDVFLYGLNDKEVDQDSYDLAKSYPSNTKFVNNDRLFNNYRFSFTTRLDSFLNSDRSELSKEANRLIDSLYVDNYDNELVHRFLIQNAATVEEERRLLYVAMTRAKKHLFIDVSLQQYSPILREIFEINKILSDYEYTADFDI